MRDQKRMSLDTEWIAKAEGDWEALEILLTSNSPGLRDVVVFHAQQCVE